MFQKVDIKQIKGRMGRVNVSAEIRNNRLIHVFISSNFVNDDLTPPHKGELYSLEDLRNATNLLIKLLDQVEKITTE